LIVADSSTWVAYLELAAGPDVELLQEAVDDLRVRMAPAALTELLSGPLVSAEAAGFFSSIPLLDILPGYWERAGRLRAGVLASGRRARLGDALIAQSCLDYDLALLTRDRDFTAFTAAGLRLWARA
jgi:hypothetical protein